MTTKRKKWLIAISSFVGIAIVAMIIVASVMARRFEPRIREEVILYLEKRFDSEVELKALHIHLPTSSSLRIFLTRGRGAMASVDGEGILLRHKGRRDVPPMFAIHSFSFNVDLAMLFADHKTIQNVTIDGMEINIPPKGERPSFDSSNVEDQGGWQRNVVIDEVLITNSRLTILPRNPAKVPLRFDLHQVRLESAGKAIAMKFAAALTNAKPPGEILSNGTFGPWAAEEPGDTPLAGDYHFDKADLGVFAGISGILHSTGNFEGTLSSIDVSGEASVPNFTLKRSGNAVPLTAHFQVHVDGTNGDTVLKPVLGTLGTTSFSTSGALIENDAKTHRSINLKVTMPKGNIRDLMALAMKGPPFMEGTIALNTSIDIPPLSGKVREKLRLEGTFEITEGKFLQSTIQDQIDSLSRRSQGQPGNEEIDEVVLKMGGRFKLENEVIGFTPVSFAVPGAGIDLTGSFDLDQDILEFQGTLRMNASISQTMTGWKHWVLRPIDPFFSKQGAGTLLNIKVEGTAEHPTFGLNRGGKKNN
jgi:hypothetical protein